MTKLLVTNLITSILLVATSIAGTESVSIDTKTKKVQNPVVKFGSGNTLDCTGATVTNCGSGSGVAWGAITGTLSNQTDLQSALNAKGSGTVTSIATTSPITGGTITGTGTIALDHTVDLAMTHVQTISSDDSLNNGVTSLINLIHTTTGTPANGLGSRINLQGETSTNATRSQATIEATWSDVTDSTATSYLKFSTRRSGSTTEQARIWGSGAVSINNTTDPSVPGISARFIPQAHAVTSATSWTPDSNTYDQEAQTALAGDLTVNAPSGTPSDGKKLILRVKNNGTPHNITWNGAYNPVGITLPATIGASKTIYVGVIWNNNTSVWDALVTSGD